MADLKATKPQYSTSNPKIDIFVCGVYDSSTNWYKSIAHYVAHHPHVNDRSNSVVTAQLAVK